MIENIVGFEHLHLHSDFSLLDGFGQVEEYSARAPKINQKFLCISDHGMMGAIPRQIKACEKYNISPIFACELYVNPMQIKAESKEDSSNYFKSLNDIEKKKFRKSCHLLAIAYNETGYKNLVKLSSWGYQYGFYYRPRINHEILLANKEGIIFTSCCYNSEIGWAFETSGEDAAYDVIEKYMAMFGSNFYLEIMFLDFVKQKPYDAFIAKASEKYNLPVIVTNDCHYCLPEDSHMQRLMLMVQTKKTISEIQALLKSDDGSDAFELQDKNLWMKSEEEINQKWVENYQDVIDKDLFISAKLNTVKICEKAANINLDRSVKLPKIPDAKDKLIEAICNGVEYRKIPNDSRYSKRILHEYELIVEKEFDSYFLIQKMMVDEARRICPQIIGVPNIESYAVGWGRGSAVGSLICYCLGITNIDPIKYDLLFERFLNPSRGGKMMKLRFQNVDPILNED